MNGEGVALARASNGTFWTHAMAAGKPYRAFPEAEAAALVDVAEAARAYRDFVKPRQHTVTPESLTEWHAVKDEFYAALDRLDDARQSSGGST